MDDEMSASAPSEDAVTAFSYDVPAELYIRYHHGPKRSLLHRRFATAAAALQFAMEDLPADAIILLETEQERLEGPVLKAMYDADAYPLARATA
jgi:hypothetical protein